MGAHRNYLDWDISLSSPPFFLFCFVDRFPSLLLFLVFLFFFLFLFNNNYLSFYFSYPLLYWSVFFLSLSSSMFPQNQKNELPSPPTKKGSDYYPPRSLSAIIEETLSSFFFYFSIFFSSSNCSFNFSFLRRSFSPPQVFICLVLVIVSFLCVQALLFVCLFVDDLHEVHKKKKNNNSKALFQKELSSCPFSLLLS